MAHYFLTKSAKELKVESKILASDACQKLKAFHWPGNVRQLENTCRWLTVMAPGQTVTEADLPPEILTNPIQHTTSGDWLSQFQAWFDSELKKGRENIWPDVQAELEVKLINTALQHCNGHKQDAAVKIGWGRNTLTRKLKERNLND